MGHACEPIFAHGKFSVCPLDDFQAQRGKINTVESNGRRLRKATATRRWELRGKFFIFHFSLALFFALAHLSFPLFFCGCSGAKISPPPPFKFFFFLWKNRHPPPPPPLPWGGRAEIGGSSKFHGYAAPFLVVGAERWEEQTKDS